MHIGLVLWQELSSGPSAAIVLGDQEEDDKNFSEWMPEPVGVQPGESAASLGCLRMCMWVVVCVVYSQVTYTTVSCVGVSLQERGHKDQNLLTLLGKCQ